MIFASVRWKRKETAAVPWPAATSARTPASIGPQSMVRWPPWSSSREKGYGVPPSTVERARTRAPSPPGLRTRPGDRGRTRAATASKRRPTLEVSGQLSPRSSIVPSRNALRSRKSGEACASGRRRRGRSPKRANRAPRAERRGSRTRACSPPGRRERPQGRRARSKPASRTSRVSPPQTVPSVP